MSTNKQSPPLAQACSLCPIQNSPLVSQVPPVPLVSQVPPVPLVPHVSPVSPVPKICSCGSHPIATIIARAFPIQNSKFKILLLRLALSALSSRQTGQTDK